MEVPLYFAIEARNLKKGLYGINRFMGPEELERVLEWDYPVPICLTVKEKQFKKIEEGEKVKLTFEGIKVAEIEVEEKFYFPVEEYGLRLYKKKEHPGYQLFTQHHTPFGIAGKVLEVENADLNLEWKTVTGFQTRNIPHIGHEKVHRRALEITKGLLLTPVLGIKNRGDFRNEIIMNAYNTYVKVLEENAALKFLFLNMRYLGPREAVFHAIVRKNLGCTHFVVGRDHAGVAGMYKPYEAYEVAKSLNLGIEIIGVKEVGFCEECGEAREVEECPHPKKKISGTYIREKLRKGENPHPFLRKEIFEAIKKHKKLFVDEEEGDIGDVFKRETGTY